MTSKLSILAKGLQLNPLPPAQGRDSSVPHKNRINVKLTKAEKRLAIQNALRYFPSHLHDVRPRPQ